MPSNNLTKDQIERLIDVAEGYLQCIKNKDSHWSEGLVVALCGGNPHQNTSVSQALGDIAGSIDKLADAIAAHGSKE